MQPVEIQEPYDLSESFNFSRAISHGMDALKAQPLGMLLGGLILVFTQGGGGGGGGGNLGQSGQLGEAELMMLGALFGVAVCCGVVFMIFRSWFEPGWYRFHRALASAGNADLGVMFSGSDAFVSTLLWKLLKGVIVFGTLTMSSIPGGALIGLGYVQDQSAPLMIAGGVLILLVMLPAMIYVSMGLMMGERAIAIDGYKPMDALELSWAMARGNRVHLFIFSVVTGIFGALGLLLCCVGIVATRAIVDFGLTEAYLLATRDEARGYTITSRG